MGKCIIRVEEIQEDFAARGRCVMFLLGLGQASGICVHVRVGTYFSMWCKVSDVFLGDGCRGGWG